MRLCGKSRNYIKINYNRGAKKNIFKKILRLETDYNNNYKI